MPLPSMQTRCRLGNNVSGRNEQQHKHSRSRIIDSMPRSGNVRVVNIEMGFPNRTQARSRIEAALVQAKKDKDGVTILKFIHGYGSTGTGGLLRFAVRSYLRQQKKHGKIISFVNGESLSSFDALSKDLVRHAPELLLDSDWGAANRGVTLV